VVDRDTLVYRRFSADCGPLLDLLVNVDLNNRS
jgi:hypothetical protein